MITGCLVNSVNFCVSLATLGMFKWIQYYRVLHLFPKVSTFSCLPPLFDKRIWLVKTEWLKPVSSSLIGSWKVLHVIGQDICNLLLRKRMLESGSSAIIGNAVYYVFRKFIHNHVHYNIWILIFFTLTLYQNENFWCKMQFSVLTKSVCRKTTALESLVLIYFKPFSETLLAFWHYKEQDSLNPGPMPITAVEINRLITHYNISDFC